MRRPSSAHSVGPEISSKPSAVRPKFELKKMNRTPAMNRVGHTKIKENQR